MTGIARILATTDFSPVSLMAVDRGFQLAASTGAAYAVAHALGLDPQGLWRALVGDDGTEVTRQAMAHQRQVLEAIVAAPERPPGVSADVTIEAGAVTTALQALATSSGADLVVMGATGQGLLKQVLIGSTASRFLRKSPCPVLVVRNPGQAPYRRTLIAVDFSPASATAIRLARDLTQGAPLVLLHVVHMPFEHNLAHGGVPLDRIDRYYESARRQGREDLHALARQVGLTDGDYEAVVDCGPPAARLLAQAEAFGCDLIAMGKHGTHMTEELLFGSVTHSLLSTAAQDLLVVVDKRGARIDDTAG